MDKKFWFDLADHFHDPNAILDLCPIECTQFQEFIIQSHSSYYRMESADFAAVCESLAYDGTVVND